MYIYKWWFLHRIKWIYHVNFSRIKIAMSSWYWIYPLVFCPWWWASSVPTSINFRGFFCDGINRISFKWPALVHIWDWNSFGASWVYVKVSSVFAVLLNGFKPLWSYWFSPAGDWVGIFRGPRWMDRKIGNGKEYTGCISDCISDCSNFLITYTFLWHTYDIMRLPICLVGALKMACVCVT